MRIVVVFPAPFGPRNASTSPLATEKLTRSRAVCCPYRFVTCWTSIIICGDWIDRVGEYCRWIGRCTLTGNTWASYSVGLGQSISCFRSLSGIDRSTAANDSRPSASFSVRKNPQRIPANTPPVFPGLRPCIWPHLLRLVTKAMPDRLLAACNFTRFLHPARVRSRVDRPA